MLKIFQKGTRTLNSAQETWVVRWNYRVGDYLGDVKEKIQVFTNEEEAIQFKESLDLANKLIGHTCSKMKWNKIEKMNNGL